MRIGELESLLTGEQEHLTIGEQEKEIEENGGS